MLTTRYFLRGTSLLSLCAGSSGSPPVQQNPSPARQPAGPAKAAAAAAAAGPEEAPAGPEDTTGAPSASSFCSSCQALWDGLKEAFSDLQFLATTRHCHSVRSHSMCV